MLKPGSVVLTSAALVVLVAGLANTANAFPWSQDLRRQASIKTQEMPRPQPKGSVCRNGRGSEVIPDDPASDALVSPLPSSPASIARGKAAWNTLCITCHGAGMKGDGMVVKKGMMPPPTLVGTNANSMGKSDGYIYGHIRRGGPLMPPYNFAVSSNEAWDLVHYVRAMQKTGGPK